MKEMKLDIFNEDNNFMKSYKIFSEEGFEDTSQIIIYDNDDKIIVNFN